MALPPSLYERITEEEHRRQAFRRLERYVAADSLPPKAKLKFGMAGRKHILFHKSPQFGRVVIGSNKSAKTVAGVMESYWWLTGSHPWLETPAPPIYGRCVCPALPGSMDNPHVQRDTLKEWCPPNKLRGGTWEEAYNATSHAVHFANGSVIEYLSWEQDVAIHASENRHFIWFDEEGSRPIFTENIARLAREGVLGSWWWTYAPILGLQWMENEIFKPGLKAGWVWQVEIWDNEHNLPPGFIEQFSATLREDDKGPRLHGRYGRRQGLVYDVFGPDNVTHFTIELDR